MLTQERHNEILRILREKNTVGVSELSLELDTSESTIRRDLNTLSNKGLINKFHGGAELVEKSVNIIEQNIAFKAGQNKHEKLLIARYAASLIEPGDFIYIDAGTTTVLMIENISSYINAVFVTNGITHARLLAARGFKTYVVGGILKQTTEAVIGAQALGFIEKFNFNKCFMGANGITIEGGYSTPEPEEGLVKREVIKRSVNKYILADSSKMGKVSAVSFASLSEAELITDCITNKRLAQHTTVKEVKE